MADEKNKPKSEPAPQPKSEPIKPRNDLSNEFRKGGEPKQTKSGR